MSTYYLYDGTTMGFYSAVFEVWKDRSAVLLRDSVQAGFFDRVETLTADEGRATRVCQTLYRFDRYALTDVEDLLRSDHRDAPDVAFRYIRSIVRYRAPVRNRLHETDVLRAVDLLRSIRNEIHNMCGFLRFSETVNGVMYAPYSPDNDITERLMPHFVARFRESKFMIHDVKRKIAGLYDGKRTLLCAMPKGEIVLSEEEAEFVRLWQSYYDSVNIRSRQHLKQMRAYMPVRYWKFMPEKSALR